LRYPFLHGRIIARFQGSRMGLRDSR
jgi:hypothetical protein